MPDNAVSVATVPTQKGVQTMAHERTTDGIATQDLRTNLAGILSRRHLIGAALSSFVVGIYGLFRTAGIEDAAAHDHHPVRRLQDRADQRRHKRRNERARHRRQRRHSNTSGGNQPQEPLGCIYKRLDMTITFKNTSAQNHTMSVADGGGDQDEAYITRWPDHVVTSKQQFSFVGWYPGMKLELKSVTPNLLFEAYNPCDWYPTMGVSKRDASSRTGWTVIDPALGYSVHQHGSIAGTGAIVTRQPDKDEHKVFEITYS
jgi:hypothetical protein